MTAFTDQEKLWGVMRKTPKGGQLHPVDAQINRIIASQWLLEPRSNHHLGAAERVDQMFLKYFQ